MGGHSGHSGHDQHGGNEVEVHHLAKKLFFSIAICTAVFFGVVYIFIF